MKVSIITATYNSERYLQHCIDSISQQSYPIIEHIIIDGSSTDLTVKIIEQNASTISRFISEPDAGIYDAINKGINLATGDIIGILNSDDFFADRDVVSRIVNAFKKSGSEIVFSDIDFVTAATDKTVRHYSSKLFRPWMFRFGFMPAHPTFYTYRRNFEKYNLYRTDMKISGDFELLLRYITVYKLSYTYVYDTWVKMRTGGVSTSGVRSIMKLNSEIVLSFRLNRMHTNYLFVYSKYIFKWWSFLRRN